MPSQARSAARGRNDGPRRRQLLDNPFAQGLPVNVFGRGIHQQPCPLGHSLSFQQLCREPEILQPSIDTGPQEDLMDSDPPGLSDVHSVAHVARKRHLGADLRSVDRQFLFIGGVLIRGEKFPLHPTLKIEFFGRFIRWEKGKLRPHFDAHV